MFDIDHFKNVNDTYGHDVGDDVLRDFSKVAKESLRSIDRFARWGGEEFIALLPRTDIEGAYKTAERIRRRFAEHRLATPRGETVTATVSTGVAAFDQGGKDMMEIVKAADQALYAAKSNGRNQVATRPSKDPVT
jgi:diguanylate cyclase (GGDEF)-like protein